ncbi:MAG: cytochrome b/b6 domain-containing protein, partial [Candidatus Zixiibacteriota bacterium]
MKEKVFLFSAGIFPLLLLLMTGILQAEEPLPTSEDCLACHEEAAEVVGATLDSLLARSIHEGLECLDCHTGIGEVPHEEQLPKVTCGECHPEEVEIYQWHGRLHVPEGEDIPTCADCHGRHDILPSSLTKSRVNPVNLPQTCGRCHEDLDLTIKHEILFKEPVEIYEGSVHGIATSEGVAAAPTCNDCHSTGRTAHRILPPSDTESTINHFNIPKTCGTCHQSIEEEYWEGIHGKLSAQGEADSPVCTDCHGEHGIIPPSDPRSRVSPIRVAEATCSPCHESARLNEKYGVPIRRIDSYHGLKSEAGDITVANCASCHGAHRILPHTDPRSSIHPENLQKTCGACHPGISAVIAQTPIHGTPGVTRTRIADIVRQIYILAIIIIIGGMVAYVVVDFRKQVRNVSKKRQIVRMAPGEVWQHTLLMITFIVLVITGFSLRFSESWWVRLLFGWEGGFPLRGLIHRVAAVVFILSTIWHLFYLTRPPGRRFIKDMLPAKADLKEFFQMLAYNLGIKKEGPRFSRFSYVEKAEYWALVWGTMIMIFTGLFLWFENFAVR